MAKFSITMPTGLTLYAQLQHPTDPTQIWDTAAAAYETVNAASWSDYDFAMPEVAAGTGTYVSTADFPATITAPGTYPYVVRLRSGASPATTDPVVGTGTVEWDGSSEASDTPWVTTRAYVKLANGWQDTTEYDDLVDQMLPGVTAGISKFLRRNPLVADDVAEARSGPGGDWVRTYATPVNSIDTITFDYRGTGEVEVDGDQFVFDADTGIIKFKPQATTKYAFTSGFQSLLIEYNAGWVTVPDDVQLAGAIICRKLQEHGDADRLVTEKTEGNRKVKYGSLVTQATTGAYADPIFGEAVGLLTPHRVVRCA